MNSYMHSTRFIDEPHICQACFYLNMRSHNRLHNTRAFPSTTTPNQAQAQVCNYIPFCTSDMGPPVPQPQSALKSCAFTYLLTQHTWVPQHHNPKSSSSHVPLRTCLHSTRGFPSTTTPNPAQVMCLHVPAYTAHVGFPAPRPQSALESGPRSIDVGLPKSPRSVARWSAHTIAR